MWSWSANYRATPIKVCGPATFARRSRHRTSRRRCRRSRFGAAAPTAVRWPAAQRHRGFAVFVRKGDRAVGDTDRPFARLDQSGICGVQVDRVAVLERQRRPVASGLDRHALKPFGDRVGGDVGFQREVAPIAMAASARCTAASCNRRRIHQFAGRGPRKVQTGVSTPDCSTASISRCAPPCSQEIASANT